MQELIKSLNLKHDMAHNGEHLYRYVSCLNPLCSNEESSADYDAPRHSIAGYDFHNETESFRCQSCGQVAKSECEFNTGSQDYLPPAQGDSSLLAAPENYKITFVCDLYMTRGLLARYGVKTLEELDSVAGDMGQAMKDILGISEFDSDFDFSEIKDLTPRP